MNDKKNKAKKIVDGLEKALGALDNSQPVGFKIENSDGKEIEVSKEEFVKFVEGDENHVQSPKDSKETLTYFFKWDIDGSEIGVERTSKNKVYKESYYQPRSEEDKKMLIKQSKKRREGEEKNQKENSLSKDKVKDYIDLSKVAHEVNRFQQDIPTTNIEKGSLFTMLISAGMIMIAKSW